jgi:hypothetical protein
MSGKYNDLSSLNSPSESSISSSSYASGSNEKKAFSILSPSTWSTPSVSGLFKSESCEEKKDKTINAATKTIEKAKADAVECVSKRSPKPAASSGSMFSFLGFGSTPAATAAATAPKVGGRKKTQKKQKKQKKPKKSNKRRT